MACVGFGGKYDGFFLVVSLLRYLKVEANVQMVMIIFDNGDGVSENDVEVMVMV